MRKVQKSLTIFTLLFLNSCAVKTISECPIDVPDVWRKPLYEDLTTGFIECGNNYCLTDADSKRVVKNQQTCESIRRGLIEFIDDVKLNK